MNNFLGKIQQKISNHKTLINNFSYLSALQLINMLIPLITYPYLIRVLGKETYGLVVFAQAIIGYLMILVSFGFNVSATQSISVNRDNKEKLNEIVSSVLIIKIILFIFSFLLLFLILLFIPKAHGYEILFLLTMSLCFSDLLFPVWYFQGIEEMKYITYITLISRLAFLILIFVLIKTPNDYLLVPIIYGIGYLISGVIALYIIFSKHKIQFRFQALKTLKHYFTDSFPLFISNLSVSLYVSTNKVITGLFLGMEAVAYYDLAEKLTTVMKVPQSILSQTLFPKISKDKNIGFVKRIFKLSLFFHVVFIFSVLLLSKHIILILGGVEMLPAQVVVNILILTVPIIAMSNIFGYQILVPFGHKKTFSKVVVSSGIIYFIQILILWITVGFSIVNISIITLTTEIFVTGYMFYNCKKFKLWI